MAQTQDPFLQRVALDYQMAVAVDAPELGSTLTPVVDAALYRRRIQWGVMDRAASGAATFLTYEFTVPAGEMWRQFLWIQKNNGGSKITVSATIADKDGSGFDPEVANYDVEALESGLVIGDMNVNPAMEIDRYRRPKELLIPSEWLVTYSIRKTGGTPLAAGALYQAEMMWERLPAARSTIQVFGPVVQGAS